MPTAGNVAASTAAPQPPNTSQNVPKNSAPMRFDMSMLSSPRLGVGQREAHLRAVPKHSRSGLAFGALSLSLTAPRIQSVNNPRQGYQRIGHLTRGLVPGAWPGDSAERGATTNRPR